MTVSSPTPRRIKGPSWLDLRLVLGVLLVLLAVLGGSVLLRSAARTTRVLAATRALAAGTTLSRGDLTWVDVRLPHTDDYLHDRADAVGKVLNRPVASGELVPFSAVGATPAHTTVSVPLAQGAAPRLTRGQRIQLWLTTPSCASVVLISDAVVQAVDAGTGVLSSDGSQAVTLALSSSDAQRVVDGPGHRRRRDPGRCAQRADERRRPTRIDRQLPGRDRDPHRVRSP